MSNIFNYLIIHLSNVIVIIYLSDVSDIVNYLIIQKFDISSMSNLLKHLFIYLSDVFGVSDIVNYLIIQQFDISSMSDVLIHLIIAVFNNNGILKKKVGGHVLVGKQARCIEISYWGLLLTHYLLFHCSPWATAGSVMI